MKTRWFSIVAGLLLTAGSAQAWYGGPAAPWYGPYAYPQPPTYSGSYNRAPGIRVETHRDADGYIVDIQLRGLKPADVTIARSGRWLIVEKTGRESSSERNEGSYSYSRSFGTVRRQLTLPRNADLDAMVREDGEDSILLRIPYQER